MTKRYRKKIKEFEGIEDKEKRKNRVSIYLTDQEFKQLYDLVLNDIDENITIQMKRRLVSEHVKSLAFKSRPTVPEINQQAWFELSKLNANLNQYMKQVNQKQKEIEADEIYETVKLIREKLIGVMS